MVYLFYGVETYFIQQEINKIRISEGIEDVNVSKYEYNSDNIKNIIEDASTMSLFQDKKLIVVSNAYIFTNQTKKKESNIESDLLLTYLDNINPNTYLIFTNDKINNTKKVTKSIKKNGIIKEFNVSTSLNNLVKEELKEYKIDTTTINFFLDRVGNNVLLIKQELEKLKNYKLEEKEINKQDVEDLVEVVIELDIFKLIDDIVRRKKSDAMTRYLEMIKHGEEPLKIVIMLANQFRLMYQTRIMINQGYKEQDIAKELNVHPYPVKLALQKSRDYDTDRLLNILAKLADIDIDIKQGKIDKKLALELFILEL